jgi:hypothetical protein
VEHLEAIARRPVEQRLDLGLVANEDYAQARIGGGSLHGAGNDRTGGVVAAHGVQCDLHRLLLSLGWHDLTALIKAAVGADAVRQHRLFTPRTVLDLSRFEVVVAAPHALARVGGTSLRNGHVCYALR